jgi:hypothetical protein
MKPLIVLGIVLMVCGTTNGVLLLVLSKWRLTGIIIAIAGLVSGAACLVRSGGAKGKRRSSSDGNQSAANVNRLGKDLFEQPPAPGLPGQPAPPLSAGDLDDDPVVGEATVSQAFIPDTSVQAVPGLGEIYAQIQSGAIQGYLAVIDGPDRPKGIALGSEPITIGRGAHNTFQLKDPGTSHDQVTIVYQNGRAFATDNRSKNGTFINNQRILTHELSSCDIVAFGSTKLLVTLG